MLKLLILISLLSPAYGFSNDSELSEEEKQRAKILNQYGGGVEKYEKSNKSDTSESLEKLDSIIIELDAISEKNIELLDSDAVLNSTMKEMVEKKIRERIVTLKNLLMEGNDLKNKKNDLSTDLTYQQELDEYIEKSEELISNFKDQEEIAEKVKNFANSSDKNEKSDKKLDFGMLSKHQNKVINQMLKENPFSKLPRSELEEMFKVRLGDTETGRKILNNKKLLNILIEVFHDKKAFPSLFSVLKESKKMKIYASIFFLVFVITFFVNFSSSKAGFFKRIFMKLTMMIVGSGVNFLVFYILFSKQLSPLIDAIIRGWSV